MIQDELTQEAKNAILKAVRESLGLKFTVANLSIVNELNESGYGDSFGRSPQFTLTGQAIAEIIDILTAHFFN